MEVRSQLVVQIGWFIFGIQLQGAYFISSLVTLGLSMSASFIPVNRLLVLAAVINRFIWGRFERLLLQLLSVSAHADFYLGTWWILNVSVLLYSLFRSVLTALAMLDTEAVVFYSILQSCADNYAWILKTIFLMESEIKLPLSSRFAAIVSLFKCCLFICLRKIIKWVASLSTKIYLEVD